MLTAGRREILLAGTRRLIERWGFERYVSAATVEPTDRFFPDPYTADLRGVRTVARRLMAHVGLVGAHVDAVGVDRADDDPLAETVVVLQRATEASITLRVHQIGPAEDVPLVLTHAVARAYTVLRPGGKGVYRAPAPDTDSPDTAALGDDDEQSAFAAGYLGLGLLVALGAHRYKSSGELAGTLVVTRWQHQRLGVLAPDEACFLLAARAVVQRVDDATIKRWRRLLAANERKSFGESLRDLRRDRPALLEALGLPAEPRWPEVQAPGSAPLPDDGWQPPEVQLAVFRARHDHGIGGVLFGGLVGVAGFAALALVPSPVGVLLGAAVLPVATYAGYRVGRRVRSRDTCSGCERELPDDATACAGCGGEIRGVLGPGQTHLVAVAEASGLLEEVERLAEEELKHAAPRYVEAGVCCPTCGWIPDGDAHWRCHACEGALSNTFAHGGQCPDCDEVFEEVVCPMCDHLAPYEWWWPPDDRAGEG